LILKKVDEMKKEEKRKRRIERINEERRLANYPKYYLIGTRPYIHTGDSDIYKRIQAFNWKTGEMEASIEAELRFTRPGVDMDELSKEEFDHYLAELRGKLGYQDNKKEDHL
jgi:hypothetical protein